MSKKELMLLFGFVSATLDNYDIDYTYIPNYNFSKYNLFTVNKNIDNYLYCKVNTKPKGKRKIYYRR